jgi:hypothetical protein
MNQDIKIRTIKKRTFGKVWCAQANSKEVTRKKKRLEETLGRRRSLNYRWYGA